MEPYLDARDIQVLREACRARFDALTQLLLDKRITSALSAEAKSAIEHDIQETNRVWSKLPDEGV